MADDIQPLLPFRKKDLRPQRKKTHGGARLNAGRKPNEPGRPRLRHAKRAQTKARFPVHITKRMRRGLPWLRRFELCKVLRRAFVHGCRMDISDESVRSFRICQFSIQGNHIHMICEATDNDSLARGVQGWSVRVARGLNGYWEREGSVFDDRYHVEILTTPAQTRNALCYALQNARRHGERMDPKWGGADPFSSAWWFDGWHDERWKAGLSPPEMRPVAEPETWLLKVGWKRSKCGSCGCATGPMRELDTLPCYFCSARRDRSAARASSMSSHRAS
jgi:REP element-mobilizing transposase RayT